MHSICFGRPSAATRRFVRFYAQRQSQLGSSVLIHPVPARSAQMLNFEFGDNILVRNVRDGSLQKAEGAALIGVQSFRRVELLIQGQVEGFTAFLQPSALNLMFGIPATTIANSDCEASGLLGFRIRELRERLGNCRSFQQRIVAAEEFFSQISSRSASLDAAELVANEIVRLKGVCRMDALAQETGLSSSTFQRRFRQAVGLAPKVYARIVRFESAAQKKASSPHLTWTEVACECGYYDQMHMIHDFEQLSTETPSGLLFHLTTVFQPGLLSADKTHLVL